MKWGVVVFPGSDDDRDTLYALETALDFDVEPLWHADESVAGVDAIALPGGFSYGDYLRCGALARFSPIMRAVAAFAESGGPVLGICNGFQILCEAGLLPGALVENRDLRFVCRPIHLRVEDTGSVLTRSAAAGDVLEIPLNSYEGNYVADPEVLDELERTSGVILRYCDPNGAVSDAANPNGAARSIAGVARGSVAGLMPHPERAVEAILGSSDGLALLGSFVDSLTPSRV